MVGQRRLGSALDSEPDLCFQQRFCFRAVSRRRATQGSRLSSRVQRIESTRHRRRWEPARRRLGLASRRSARIAAVRFGQQARGDRRAGRDKFVAGRGDDDEHHDDDNEYHGDEVTLLLIKLSSPMGLLSLPKEVNAESALQAASPAYEVTRLLQIVGIGLNWLNAFAGVLILSAALSIFAALYASLRARRHDLAVMRCLGATRGELFYLLFIEGLTLTVLGIAIGLCFAHGGMELLGNWLGDGQGLTISGWAWAQEEFVLIAGLLVTGSLTALLPAWQAYQTDVSRTLSSP